MSNAILQFKTLSDLAKYSKTIDPQEYIINTLQLTLISRLSEFEVAVALEEYKATLVYQMAHA